MHSLLPYNTFHLDVRTKYFEEYESIDALCALLTRYAGVPMLHIGEGSNLLFTQDFDGVVLHSRIRFVEKLTTYNGYSAPENTIFVRVGSGIVMDELIMQVVEEGLSGLENLSYIPGEVGASAVQNVGAYGVEAKDTITWVEVLDRENLQVTILSNTECAYGYRDSRFKHEWKERYIVTAVVFGLHTNHILNLEYGNLRFLLADIEQPTIKDVREAVIRVRQSKLPKVSELGSAGSFFMNPMIGQEYFKRLQMEYPTMPFYQVGEQYKIPAAWLIEQCGWKGKRLGGAQVYEKQPLVIVNVDHAQPQDIVNLAGQIIESIKQKFGIELHPEVNYI